MCSARSMWSADPGPRGVRCGRRHGPGTGSVEHLSGDRARLEDDDGGLSWAPCGVRVKLLI
jgi:hypothetical protein